MEADFRRLDPVMGDFGDVFDGVGAQLGEFDIVTCFGKLQLVWSFLSLAPSLHPPASFQPLGVSSHFVNCAAFDGHVPSLTLKP
jgi:hypothetical protein